MDVKQNTYPGGVPMVQIDGGKIRAIREQKGLTQLYLASVVAVTTDSISRWENKRYPTIKKENALKLAEALEVELADILDAGHKALPDEPEGLESTEQAPEVTAPEVVSKSNKSYWVIGLVVAVAALALFAWLRLPVLNGVQIHAVRFMPDHTAPGQPFPVVIKLVSSDSQPSPFILREMLPAGATLVESQKSIPAAVDHKTGEMKWINKVTEKMVLGYSLRYDGPVSQEGLRMNGTVTLRKVSGRGKAIAGNNRIAFAPYHWADSNKDNFIDDLEILAVYEDFSDATGLDLEMDLIEDIWFGGGYVWNVNSKKFEIIP
nr:helix-turn-helix transcriptional regulator [Desulfobulbaceae bacterium]